MSKDKKQNNFKFNNWWVYGSLIGILLIIQLFSGSIGTTNGITTTPSKFFIFLRNGDVKKVEIVNKRKALVYLIDKALSKEVHRKSKPNQFLPIGTIPNYNLV